MPTQIGSFLTKAALTRATSGLEGARYVGARVAGISALTVQGILQALKDQIDAKISTTAKGQANGVAELDASTLVPASRLPKATQGAFGAARLSSAPADPSDPIGVGDNDARIQPAENPREVGTTGNPGFANSWTNYEATYNTAAFYKDRAGRVHLKGMVKNATAYSSTIAVIFTLPAGYRPPGRELRVTISNQAIARVDISTTGEVQLQQGSNLWLSLDGISFRAA